MTMGEFVPGHMPAHLREYWVHGKGALKIKWGLPHDFNRCVTHLRKYFPTNPKGLCNILHREALGVAPGQEHAVDEIEFDHSECTEEFCLAPLHKGPCRGYKHGGGIHAPHVGGKHPSGFHPAPGHKRKPTNFDVPHHARKAGAPQIQRGPAEHPHRGVDPTKMTPADRVKAKAQKGVDTRLRAGVDRLNGIDSAIKKLGPSSTWTAEDKKTHRKLLQQRQQLIKQMNEHDVQVEELVDVTEELAAADNERDTCGPGQHMMPNGECMDDDAEEMYGLMSAKDINDLPDSAFGYIEPGGSKDADGKTVPRSLRHFPIHDAAHVRNALARASQSPFGSKAMTKIRKAAKKMGVGDYAADTDIDDAELFAMMPKTKGWRGMIAPIDKPTGDGRRFGPGSLSNRDLPLPARFQRSSGEGHSGAVTVGRLTNVEYKDDGVWGEGDWMDPEVVPEVTEAQLLMEKDVLGGSVDLDEFQFEARHKGSGDKFSPEKHCKDGTCDASEAYVTNGRISALTFVAIPAFAESAKLELYEIVDEGAVRAAFAADGFDLDDEDCGCGEHEETVVAATVVVERPSEAVFSRQDSDMVGFASRGEQLFGYVADRNTCHTEIKGMCRRPPVEDDYSLFHRYLVPAATDSGLIAAGRFTVGYGRFVGQCGCCNADDHACSYLNMADTIAHYDLLDKVIDARVGVDDKGIWWAGTWASEATEQAKAIVAKRGMSGDWRMLNGQLHLVEVMGVSVTRPAFPIGGLVDGRQLSLVAAGPLAAPVDPLAELPDMVSRAVAQALALDRRRLEAAWMMQGLDQHRSEFVAQERERLLAKMGGI